ncbi:MAG TPA: exosortase A [Vicinamibacterales bacterium]|jgi:exosortase|nr:exosortase A [Vicinamibacterales bacterium]
MSRGFATRIGSLIAVGAGVALYWPVITKLVHDWLHDDNYSHGILIVPLAAFFVWERRRRLAMTADAPRLWGLLVVVFGLVMLLAGQLGAELFLGRTSMLFVLAGAIVFLRGTPALKVLAFPLAFLLLMIPLPAIIFNQIAFPLQLLASRAGEAALSLSGIPVLREGNVIVLAHITLEVAEACSGIRALVSLLTLGIVYGYFTDDRVGVRTVIALATIPIAIVANAARVAGTGIAAQYFGERAAEGFFHTFSGWLVFVAAFAMLFVVGRMIEWLAPAQATPRAAAA